jgi:hypothetical protein
MNVMADMEDKADVTAAAPNGADAPPPAAGDADGGAPPAPPEDTTDPEPEESEEQKEMRAMLAEYRERKRAEAEKAKEPKVPAPAKKKTSAPVKTEDATPDAPKEKSYGSSRWFGGR